MNASERTSAALAAAIGALVETDIDVADVLAHLVADANVASGAGAVALMARDSNGDLSLLSADSHQAVQLELLQMQGETGPCVDVLSTGEPLRVAGSEAISARWPTVGAAIVEAGFGAVEAYPMRWRGATLGGLNVFYTDPLVDPVPRLCQAFADMATLVVVQSGTVSRDHVLGRVHEALSARGLVEQAKGVIAYQEGVDLGTAYHVLLGRAETSDAPLTQAALDVIDGALRSDPRA